MGRDIGAGLAFMDCAWWSPTYTIPDGRVLALIAGKSNPGSIMVNGLGKRFANEAQPYEDLVKEQYASEARGEGAIPCYLLFDAGFRANSVLRDFYDDTTEDAYLMQFRYQPEYADLAQPVNRIAKLAGSPAHPSAGIECLQRVGDVIGENQPLFEIHAQSRSQLDMASEYATSALSTIVHYGY